jgi:hypothetical protein
MDYFGIIRRAFEITIRRRFLWVFGFIVALAGGGGGFRGFSYFSDSGQSMARLGRFATAYLGVLILVGLILFLLWLVIWILSLISQAGLVSSVNKIERGEETSLGDGFSIGAHYFWRVLGLSIILGLIIFFLVLLIALPVVAVIIFASQANAVGAGLAVPAIFCLVLGIIFLVFLLVLFAAFLGVIFIYALRYIVLKDKRVFISIGEAWRLIRANLGATLAMFLLLLLMSAGVGIVLAIPALVIGIPAFLAFLGGVTIGNVYLIVVASLGFFFLLLTVSFLRGIFETFHSTAWTLTYLELTKLETA